MSASIQIAIVQSGPACLDRAASMDKAMHLLQEAADGGAQLVVFGETWLSGYPIWLDICPDVARWDHEPVKQVYARTRASAIRIPGPETERLCAFARENNLAICMGANEYVEEGPGNGTLYNALFTINPLGEIAVHHRKLMPTHGERLLHGTGDGHGLRSADLGFARVGGLICWEHWMPLTRQAMHNSGEQIHLALWPHVKAQNILASQHYALEGRCFVIAVGQVMHARELPQELEWPDHLRQAPDTMIMQGGSCAFAPDGTQILAPQTGVEGLVWLTIDDIDMCARESMTLDVSGHYQRRDVFSFDVNRDRPS
jgi:nitrilase